MIITHLNNKVIGHSNYEIDRGVRVCSDFQHKIHWIDIRNPANRVLNFSYPRSSDRNTETIKLYLAVEYRVQFGC